jgi:hypothetical protein
MPLYFLLLESTRFQGAVRPALDASWRERSFAPCRALCEELLPVARAFAPQESTGPAASFLGQVADGLPFDRDLWRLLVGDVLMYAAADLPEIQTAPAALACLVGLAPGTDSAAGRQSWHWARQVHFGARDLTFGGAFYRPEAAGYNDTDDVARLADLLRAVRPERWRPDDLKGLPDLASDEDRADELEFMRDWLPPLRAMYDGAQAAGQVVVCEDL